MIDLVIDLTHGGVKIAISLAKKGHTVYAYDIYNTLNNIDSQMLKVYNVKLTTLDELNNLNGNINIIYPIHLPLSIEEIKSKNQDLNYTFQTHHEAVGDLLKNWSTDILKIEITGVKGKTTSVFMLKEILINENPLILSSLGALLYHNKKEIILKKDISITPANIKETVDLAYKHTNPNCKLITKENKRKYNSAIFESSLGVSGIGDIGLLLNIVEDYPIARSRSSAAKAKEQVFKCNCVCIQKEALDKYYSHIKHAKINSFSLNDKNANLFIQDIVYNLDKTKVKVKYNNVKTIKNNIYSGEINIETFAPGPHYISNVLGVILTCISLEISHEKIITGLKNFKGITGRFNKKVVKNSTIIEEVNPGLNTEAIKESIKLLENSNDYYISIGGDYGITCEEINETKLTDYLNTLKKDIFLTGDVGFSIASKMTNNYKYIENYNDIYDLAIRNNKNLLFIYRSDYKKLSNR